jgi:signal transduction histidine kinase
MENGDIVWTGTQRDITDEKRLEDEKKELEYRLQQARKTESLGRMAGAIAHNFNNQLYAVLGNLELALMDLPHGSEAAASISQAQKAADKAAQISRLMLTYLGQGLGKREHLDISSICRTALSQMMESIPTGITLTTNLLSHGPVIKADNQQIQLILINLITNAWEAIGENQGNIRLSVRTVSGGNIPLPHRLPVNWLPKESLYACLEVVDTGSGIRREDIEKICDPFYSTKFTGRGLGLSVVIGIVCAYDGGITVESQPDRGSTFLIYLPISSEEPFRKSLA